MSKLSDTYIPFRPGPVLGQRIDAHASRVGQSRSAAIRQLLDERLRQLYPEYRNDPCENPERN